MHSHTRTSDGHTYNCEGTCEGGSLTAFLARRRAAATVTIKTEGVRIWTQEMLDAASA